VNKHQGGQLLIHNSSEWPDLFLDSDTNRRRSPIRKVTDSFDEECYRAPVPLLTNGVATMSTKYELTGETVSTGGHQLYRIRALRDFGNVRAGELGGFVETEVNLSHLGNAWVRDEARASGFAFVCENALVCDQAEISGEAIVSGGAVVSASAKVRDTACVGEGSVVGENAEVFGKAKLFGYSRVFGTAKVGGRARIIDQAAVGGEAVVDGDSVISDFAVVVGRARVGGDARVGDRAIVSGDAVLPGRGKFAGVDRIQPQLPGRPPSGPTP
jgi:carbonic anhydrase/acetyltransferase-like protein (isoleucine patch superfamily)